MVITNWRSQDSVDGRISEEGDGVGGMGWEVLRAMYHVAISKFYNVLLNHKNYSIIIASSGIFRVRGKVCGFQSLPFYMYTYVQI